MKTVRAILPAAGIALAGAASADANDLRDELMRCARIEMAQERLACYDALAPESAADEGASAAGGETPHRKPTAVLVTETAAPEARAPATDNGEAPVPKAARAQAERSFGLLPGSDEGNNRIESRVVGEVHNLRRGARFELENGQVWQQVERTRRNYRATNPKVEIEEGFMNSYRMRLEGLNARIRVRRVK